jgi:hypothetical protein
LRLQESMAKHSAGYHDQWKRYMTVFVIKHGMIQSVRTLATVYRPRKRFDIDTLQDIISYEGNWALVIFQQLFTFAALHLNRVYHLPHALLQDKDSDCQPEGNQ